MWEGSVKLAIRFLELFLGGLALSGVGIGSGMGLYKLAKWLEAKTGMSENKLLPLLYCVFVALIFAGGVTAVMALRKTK